MFRFDVIVDFVEVILHDALLAFLNHRFTQIFTDGETQSFIRFASMAQTQAARKMCLMPRMGMTTQLGRWFSSYPISYTALSSK